MLQIVSENSLSSQDQFDRSEVTAMIEQEIKGSAFGWLVQRRLLALTLLAATLLVWEQAGGAELPDAAAFKVAIEKRIGKTLSACSVNQPVSTWSDCFGDAKYDYSEGPGFNKCSYSTEKSTVRCNIFVNAASRRLGYFTNGSLSTGLLKTFYDTTFIGDFHPNSNYTVTTLSKGFAFSYKKVMAGHFASAQLNGIGISVKQSFGGLKREIGEWVNNRLTANKDAPSLNFLNAYKSLIPDALQSESGFNLIAEAIGPTMVVAVREQEKKNNGALEAQKKERLAKEEAERQRAEQARQEKERLAKEETERQRAERARQEKERLAKEDADRRQTLLEQELRQLKDSLARESEERASLQKKLEKIEAGTADKLSVQPTRYGLVIGNAQYREVDRLENSVTDAKAFSDSLTELGFTVSAFYNMTQRDLLTSIREFENKLRGGDEVVFYYAGHGVQIGNTNYLLPVDVGNSSASQVRDQSVALQTILDRLSEKDVKFALAVIDACRDDPFKGTGRAIGSRGLAPTTAATGQMIIFSAGAGQQALDKLNDKDRNPNGVFTRVFLKEMKKPGVTVNGILRTVRHEVFQMARSVGHEQVPAVYDQTIGEFYFRK
jgi:hypothetical protein